MLNAINKDGATAARRAGQHDVEGAFMELEGVVEALKIVRWSENFMERRRLSPATALALFSLVDAVVDKTFRLDEMLNGHRDYDGDDDDLATPEARQAALAAGIHNITAEDIAAMSARSRQVIASHCERIIAAVSAAEDADGEDDDAATGGHDRHDAEMREAAEERRRVKEAEDTAIKMAAILPNIDVVRMGAGRRRGMIRPFQALLNDIAGAEQAERAKCERAEAAASKGAA